MGGRGALRLDFGEERNGVEGFVIIYCAIRHGETVPLRLTDERAVAQKVVHDERWPNCLLIFSDPDQRHWHFVSPRRLTRAQAQDRTRAQAQDRSRAQAQDRSRAQAQDRSRAQAQDRSRAQRYVLRRIAVSPGDRLRTAIDRFARVRLEPAEADGMTAAEIHRRHDIAFSVEEVTQSFFDQFKQRYFDLEDCLADQVDDRDWVHEFALRILSWLMFIYFVQRKQWIADDPDFMAHYWQRYQAATDGGDDSFYDRWLRPLFFNAFQDAATASEILKLDYMLEDLRRALREAPYLNGGLFAEADLDRNHAGDFAIPDSYFDSLLHASEDLTARAGFLEAYNFTISEDSPLDQEVAVDPEMIGRVYESLVNISEPGADTAGDREKQRAAGIFYTPRTEIDLMCRLSLSDYLCNHLGEEHRDLIYQLAFSLEPDEKHAADAAIAGEDLWPRVAELLEDVTVVDPACGSGSFLVGMMNILADLRLRADAFVGQNPTAYELNRDIVRTSLYGVDVMEWACHVAELRLWLQLMIHADPDPGELQGPKPLLPNLSFKIRQGDSLVQELGGVNLAHLKADADIEPGTNSELRRLRSDKLSFYDAEHQEPERERELRLREQNLFLRICREKAAKLGERIGEIARQLAATTPTLVGDEPTVKGRERQRMEAARDGLAAQAERLEQARVAIGQQQRVPFVWDLAFVEVFSGDRQGFDIVVGNPPYVRQEKIADPQAKGEQSREQRGRYKAKLQRSVYAALPRYFGSDPDRPTTAIGGRSDLYIYFYFHALSLLNENGVFCFVTSNSWLDVDYGKALQEFLARQVPMHLIIDNQVKRSFANADVNTVIVLFGAPRARRDACLDHTARFVMALTPFEQVLDPVIIQEIEAAPERTERHEFRVFPRTQRELLEAGAPAAEQPRRGGPLIKLGGYEGDKWGGKYLRAPEIYWEILERASDRLVPLGEIAEVRRGFTTGANDFFYVALSADQPRDQAIRRVVARDGSEHDLPANALMPAILSPGNVLRPRLTEADADCLFVAIPEEPKRSLHTLVRDYIAWGETRGFHERVTCASRRCWYAIVPKDPGWVLTPMARKRRALVGWNEGRLQVDHNLFEVLPHEPQHAAAIGACLASTFTVMQAELFGRANLGQGGLKTEGVDIEGFLVIDPRVVSQEQQQRLQEALEAILDRHILMIYDEVRLADRQNLDRAFVDAVTGLDTRANDAHVGRVQDAATRLVWRRLSKPGNARESRQTYDEWLASGEPFDANAEDFDE